MIMKDDCVIRTEHLSKEYHLGVIGSGTLRRDLQSWYARRKGRDDPNRRINSKSYDRNETFLALDDINIEISRGERVGIIGANGAGKSTFLKLLSRVTVPSDGEFSFRGRIASMLEVGTGFNGELTGRENIYLNGAIIGMTKAEIDSKIESIIRFSECERFIDTPVKRYSSGMFVKLAFAVAAHLDAEIMIMDEVLAVGDMQFQKKCIDKMRELALNENRTILYVSHNMNTIRDLCSRCIVLSKGKVIFDGDVEEGIKIYLGGEQDNFIHFQYPRDFAKRQTPDRQDIYIDSAAYIGKTDNIFNDDEKLELTLKWSAVKDVSNLCLRIELCDYRRIPVTAFIIEDFCSCIGGQTYKQTFSADISQLAGGGYYTRYVFYNQSDENFPFETVEDVPGLTIRKRRAEKNKNIWQKKWGSIIMNDIELIDDIEVI